MSATLITIDPLKKLKPATKKRNDLNKIKSQKKQLVHMMSPEELVEYKKKEAGAGIIYLSSVPCGMQFHRLRQEFERFGDVGRIHLEPKKVIKRKADAKPKFIMFKEGWVEFEKKTVARQVALSLNSQQVGGKRGTSYCNDTWNIRYLPKFKWADFQERFTLEKNTRIQKKTEAIDRVIDQNKFFSMNKSISTFISKKLAKVDDSGSPEDTDKHRVLRTFNQTAPIDGPKRD